MKKRKTNKAHAGMRSAKGKILFCDNTLWGLVNFRSYIFTHLMREGYKVVLVAPQDENTVMKAEVPEGVEYRPVRINRCGRNPLDDGRYFLALYHIYQEERPDFVFHYTIKPNVYGTFVAKLLGIPCANMMAGLGYAFQGKRFMHRSILVLYRLAMRQADKVLCLNEENRIVVGNVQQLTDIRFGTVQNRLEKLAAVREFHKTAAAALIIREFGLSLFHNRLRQHRRTGRKIVNRHFMNPPEID